MAVKLGQMLAQIAQVKIMINAAQQMIPGNVVFKIERVEQSILTT